MQFLTARRGLRLASKITCRVEQLKKTLSDFSALNNMDFSVETAAAPVRRHDEAGVRQAGLGQVSDVMQCFPFKD